MITEDKRYWVGEGRACIMDSGGAEPSRTSGAEKNCGKLPHPPIPMIPNALVTPDS